MKLTQAFVAHEWRLQTRSVRFRFAVVLYAIVSLVPLATPLATLQRRLLVVTANAFAAAIEPAAGVLAAFFAAMLAVDAISREREENAFAVVSVAPLSSAGYLLRRWIAVLTVVVPVTVLPPVIAALVAWSLTRTTSSAFAWSWVSTALPSALVFSAIALALGTITGRTILAVIAGFAIFTFGIGIANDLLARAHLHLSGPSEILAFRPATLMRGWYTLKGYVSVRPLASDAGVDPQPLLQVVPSRVAVAAAVAFTLLGISAFFLRRSRRDLRPWKPREDHPLRSTIRLGNRLRDEFAPDGRPARADVLTATIGILGGAALIAFCFQRQAAFAAEAGRQYDVSMAGTPTPTSVEVIPTSLRIRASVGGNGKVESAATITLRNSGKTPQSHLAFEINRRLTVASVRSEAGTASLKQTWDRVAVTAMPPIAPGESRSLTFALHGTPGDYIWPFGRRNFLLRYKRFREATVAFDLLDFSQTVPLNSARSIQAELSTAELAPVPRYTPWTIAEDEDREPIVPAEAIHFDTRIETEIEFPAGFVATDSCGTSTSGTLRSSCTTPTGRYHVYAGRLETRSLDPQTTLAFLPAHRSVVETHGASIKRGVDLARASWPGLLEGGRAIFAERPVNAGYDYYYANWYFEGSVRSIHATGALHFIPEPMFTLIKPLDATVVAMAMVANRIQQRRSIATEQQQVFSRIAYGLAAVRVGGLPTNATLPPGGPPPSTDPILKRDLGWHIRLQKVMADVEHRVGSDRLVAGVNDFLARRGEGTVRELLESIASRSGVSLERVYLDYFEGSALPKLTLENVDFRRSGDGWEVSGVLRNVGTGESFCPLVLRTEFEPQRTTVRIDSGQSIAFRFTTRFKPRLVQLDPERICYRYAAVALVDSVEYRGDVRPAGPQARGPAGDAVEPRLSHARSAFDRRSRPFRDLVLRACRPAGLRASNQASS